MLRTRGSMAKRHVCCCRVSGPVADIAESTRLTHKRHAALRLLDHLVCSEEQGLSIGRGTVRKIGSHNAVHTRAVLDNDRLSQGVANLSRYQTCQHVGTATGSVGDDHLDRRGR